MKLTMNFKEDTRRLNNLWGQNVRCKCSHTFVLGKKDRAICSHCGNWVYRTPELEFKYKLKEKIKGGQNE